MLVLVLVLDPVLVLVLVFVLVLVLVLALLLLFNSQSEARELPSILPMNSYLPNIYSISRQSIPECTRGVHRKESGELGSVRAYI